MALGLVLASALLVVGCSPEGSDPAPDPPDRPAASAQQGGVSIGVTLDRGSTDTTGRIEAIVVVENRSGRTVRWRAGGCDLRGSVTVRPADVPPAAPVPVDGGERRIAAFIDVLAVVADRPADPITLMIGVQDAGRGCQTDHGFADMRTGERLTERVDWAATTVAGAPLPPGRYVVRGTFAMLPVGMPLVPATFRASRDVDPLTAETAIDVTGALTTIPTARAALEALLSATDLGDAVRTGRIDARHATITFDRGVWVVRITLPGRAVAVGRVSADGRGEPTLDAAR